MAVDRLPVYNKVRQLYDQFTASTRKSPISVKRGAMARVEDSIIRMMVQLSFADEAESRPGERLVIIRDVIAGMREVMAYVRALYDLRLVKKSGFSALITLEDNIMRQLTGWLNKTTLEIENR
jgi:hypothetical protein